MQRITVNEGTSALRRILFAAELAANTNEVQQLDLGDFATGDSFTITYSGQTTAAINFAADVSTDIDTALENLSNIDASAITVVKGTGQVYTITFGGNLAATDIANLSITPTGFTPGGVTEVQHGGVAGAPARNLTFDASEIQISKNGATVGNSAGTVTEIGNGLYYYAATSGEVDTLGVLSLAVVKAGVAITYPTVQILPASSSLGAPVIRSGTAQAGTSSSITLDSGASGTANFYVPCLVYLSSGTGAGQARLSYAYNSSTKVLSVEPDWQVAPASDTGFDLLPAPPAMADLARVNHGVVGTFGEVATPADVAGEVKAAVLNDDTAFAGGDVVAIKNRLPASLVGGRMSADIEAIAGSAVASTRLKDHAAAVQSFLCTTGSSTTVINLNTTTGINGDVPTATSSAFVGRILVFTSGALAGQAKEITAYNGTTKVVTVASAFTGSPASGDTGVIV